VLEVVDAGHRLGRRAQLRVLERVAAVPAGAVVRLFLEGVDPEAYRTDARLMEMSFGRWEGFTFAELQAREAAALAEREHDKWGFVLPGGESYAQLQVRVRAWYESMARDSVVSAHGGVCRALIAHLNLAQPEAASMGDIGQGCVYVFDGNSMARHE